jgi:nitrogen fixation-related uncharacterized protein
VFLASIERNGCNWDGHEDDMSVLWILFICSMVVLPTVALLALRWALHHGEFSHLQKTALSIFDDEEPVGRVTDHFPKNARSPNQTPDSEEVPKGQNHEA